MGDADEVRSVRVRIRGRVQGVGYRVWTRAVAEDLGLSGWVRNRADGSVEALFSGPAEDVDAMIARCRNGPLGAAVTDVAVETEEGAAVTGRGFDVLGTA